MIRSAFLAVAMSIAVAPMTGCSASAPDADADEALDEGALSATARPLAGSYAATDDGDLYATEFQLDEDGTFAGELNRALLGAGQCITSPCTAVAAGNWNVTSGRLALNVTRIDGEARRKGLSFRYELSRDALTLSGSLGEQTFTKLGAGATGGCASTTCASGERCVEREGEPTCVRDTSPSCANKVCGARCSVCNGRPGCVETAALKYCDADGQCSPRSPVCGR